MKRRIKTKGCSERTAISLYRPMDSLIEDRNTKFAFGNEKDSVILNLYSLLSQSMIEYKLLDRILGNAFRRAIEKQGESNLDDFNNNEGRGIPREYDSSIPFLVTRLLVTDDNSRTADREISKIIRKEAFPLFEEIDLLSKKPLSFLIKSDLSEKIEWFFKSISDFLFYKKEKLLTDMNLRKANLSTFNMLCLMAISDMIKASGSYRALDKALYKVITKVNRCAPVVTYRVNPSSLGVLERKVKKSIKDVYISDAIMLILSNKNISSKRDNHLAIELKSLFFKTS